MKLSHNKFSENAGENLGLGISKLYTSRMKLGRKRQRDQRQETKTKKGQRQRQRDQRQETETERQRR